MSTNYPSFTITDKLLGKNQLIFCNGVWFKSASSRA